MTPEELATIEDRAIRAGYATGAFARATLLGTPGLRAQRRLPADQAELRRLLGAVNQLGNNANQIARVLNTDDDPDRDGIRHIVAEIAAIRIAIIAALGIETAPAV